MALRTLMLKKQIDEKRKALNVATEKRTDLEKREAELEQAIEEAETEEEKAAVEEAVSAFEEEKKANDEEIADFEKTLNDLESELAEEERSQQLPQDNNPAPITNEPETREREGKTMHRTKFFGMTMEERTAFFENEEVKTFLERTRKLGKEERSVSGAELLIPTVVLSLIRENITKYSKLISKVNRQAVPGKARQNVMGTIPEAVWTEMCGKLNELSLNFVGVEVDGYKVGGFIPMCNAVLEDSDENLAAIIIDALGQAIGYALDKAIVFGTGTKMPVGIFTRIAQTSDPSDPRTTIPWVDLHATNVVKIASTKTGIDFFKEILKAAGAAKSNYARGGKFWVMNETTKNAVIAESLSINAAGAVVAGVSEQMPIVGGDIVTLEFMPDNVIVGGYGDLYLLAERDGGQFASSEHVRFTDDQTVFKGTARYDGLPVIAEGFVVIGINGTTPSASGISFANDTANAASNPGAAG
jgi:HK97 family phage major capsid protein